MRPCRRVCYRTPFSDWHNCPCSTSVLFLQPIAPLITRPILLRIAARLKAWRQVRCILRLLQSRAPQQTDAHKHDVKYYHRTRRTLSPVISSRRFKHVSQTAWETGARMLTWPTRLASASSAIALAIELKSYLLYRVCQKSDTLVNYVNIMSYKVKKNTRYLHCLNNFNIHYYWFVELCSMSPPCCSTTRVRRRRHSSMLRSMKRCDNLFHSSTMACFSWSTVVNFRLC